jgi:protein phosphatase
MVAKNVQLNTMRKFLADSKSMIGGRKQQEDALGMVDTPFGLFAVVCDGMGGAKAGNVASKMAVKIVIDGLLNYRGDNPVRIIEDLIRKANTEIFRLANTDDDYTGMGTTIAALLVQKKHATSFHVGDSRIYQVKSGKKVFRTMDHSKVHELVRLKVLTEEQARTSQESNVILRAIGIKPSVDVEINDYLPYEKKDRFLVCSDGVCGMLPDEELVSEISDSLPVEKINSNLVNKVNAIGQLNGGGHDNLTSILIECRENSELKTPLSMRSKLYIASLGALSVILAGLLMYTMMAKNSEIDRLKETINELEKPKSVAIDSTTSPKGKGAQDGKSADQNKGENGRNDKDKKDREAKDDEQGGKKDNLKSSGGSKDIPSPSPKSKPGRSSKQIGDTKNDKKETSGDKNKTSGDKKKDDPGVVDDKDKKDSSSNKTKNS